MSEWSELARPVWLALAALLPLYAWLRLRREHRDRVLHAPLQLRPEVGRVRWARWLWLPAELGVYLVLCAPLCSSGAFLRLRFGSSPQ